MTTVVYRDGVMAADSQTTRNGMISGNITKIHRVGNLVIGACGATADCCKFIDWFKGDRKEPIDWKYFRGNDDAPDVTALVAGPDGVTFWSEHCQPFPIEDEFTAIGAGQMAAMAALHMGASAKKAIEIASKCCIYTGGEIQVVKVLSDRSLVSV